MCIYATLKTLKALFTHKHKHTNIHNTHLAHTLIYALIYSGFSSNIQPTHGYNTHINADAQTACFYSRAHPLYSNYNNNNNNNF